MDRLVDPAIADLQCEYADAARSGDRRRARRVLIAGYAAVLKVAAVGVSRASMLELFTADGGAVGRTIRYSGIATTLTTAGLVWVPLRQMPAATTVSLAKLALLSVYLVPQALAVTLPLGLVFGVLCGLRGRVPTRRSRIALTLLMLGASLAALVLGGWLLPAGNQAYREVMYGLVDPSFGGRLSRGMNELTLGELRAESAYQFHFRLALASAPLVLGVLSLTLATAKRRRTHIVTAGLTALAICFAYYVLLYNARAAGMDGRLPAAVAGWAPNLVFVVLTLALHVRTRGRSATDPSRPDDGRRSADQPAIPPA
jgi:hypothetical protein